MDEAQIGAHVGRIREAGYTIVEKAIEPDFIESLAAALDRLELELDARPAANAFEGQRTVGIYNLLARGEPFPRVPVHPAGRTSSSESRPKSSAGFLRAYRSWSAGACIAV
jgi:hypothetical protein